MSSNTLMLVTVGRGAMFGKSRSLVLMSVNFKGVGTMMVLFYLLSWSGVWRSLLLRALVRLLLSIRALLWGFRSSKNSLILLVSAMLLVIIVRTVE
jgi:hypothetical protein